MSEEQQQQQQPNLPDLMRQGGKKYPAVRSSYFGKRGDGVLCACALGAALLILDPDTDTSDFGAWRLWPLFKACGINPLATVEHPQFHNGASATQTQLVYIIINLFDVFRYSHEEIARWIESLPPEQIALQYANEKDLRFEGFGD